MKYIDRFAWLIGSALLLAGTLEAQPTTHRTYDGYGNRSSLQSPFGQVRSYDHNYQGVERRASLQGQTLVRDMVFGSHGKAEQYIYEGLGASPDRLAQHAYDGLGRPTAWSLRALDQGGSADYLADTFIYDERGFLLGYRRSDRSVGIVSVAFGYTTKGQLATFDWGGQSLSYGYDEDGNLESRSGGLGVAPLADGGVVEFGPGNHRQGWLYDLRGRLVEDDQHRYEYDELGRLRLVRHRDTGLWLSHYLYDASGHRARILEPDQVTYAYRDADGGVISEDIRGRDNVTQRQREHVTLNGQRIHTLTLLADGPPQGEQHFTDRMGNPVFSWRGSKETTHVYSPYGQALSVGGSKDHQGVYGFTGHEEDGATGLTYMRARYYDADAARFNRPDPARDFDPYLPSTVNLYQYAHNNPVVRLDTTGLQSKEVDEKWVEYYEQVSKGLNWFDQALSYLGGEKYKLARAVSNINSAKKVAEKELKRIAASELDGSAEDPGKWGELVDLAVEQKVFTKEQGELVVTIGVVVAQVARGEKPTQTDLLAVGDAVGALFGPLLEEYRKVNPGMWNNEQINEWQKNDRIEE